MNNLFLFVGLFMLFLYCFRNNRFSLTSPSILFTGGFLVSSLFFLINTFFWNYYISSTTLLLLLSGTFAFIFGCNVSKNQSLECSYWLVDTKPVNLNSNTIYFLLLILVLVGVYFRVQNLSYVVGSFSIGEGELGTLRRSEISSPYTLPIKIFVPIMSAIVLYAIEFLFDVQRKTGRFSLRTLPILVGYFVFCALSSGRIEILYLFIYILVFFLQVCKRDAKFKIELASVAKVLLFILLFFATFYMLGFLTGKSQSQTSFFDNISIYTGASIGVLDYFIESFNYSVDNMFTSTFDGFANLLAYMGISIQRASADMGHNFVVLGNMTRASNVFTCYYTPIYDFNLVGAVIVMFFEGVVFQLIYNLSLKARQGLSSPVWIVFYIYITPYIFFSSIADRFFEALLTITSIIFLIVAMVLKEIFVNSSVLKK